jgi:hypothetical protein
MWIMLIKKLPTVVSPPKLSIFWAQPWALEKYAFRNKKSHIEYVDPFGIEPDYMGAMKIFYKGEQIRVFPHEFSVMDRKKMHDYIMGMEGEGISTHEFVAADIVSAAQKRLEEITDEALKPIRDAALLDGATPEMALQIAMGVDVFIPDEGIEDPDDDCGFPPAGWYRCKPEYALIYCYPEDIEETDRRKEIENYVSM